MTIKKKKKRSINLEEREKYYLQLIEEKQIELILHPAQRDQCGIHFTAEDSSCIYMPMQKILQCPFLKN